MTDLDDATKIKMLREALERLTEKVGNQQLHTLTSQTIEAYHKATSTLDGLKFVEDLAKKKDKP